MWKIIFGWKRKLLELGIYLAFLVAFFSLLLIHHNVLADVQLSQLIIGNSPPLMRHTGEYIPLGVAGTCSGNILYTAISS